MIRIYIKYYSTIKTPGLFIVYHDKVRHFPRKKKKKKTCINGGFRRFRVMTLPDQ